jgi:hypothetical protein
MSDWPEGWYRDEPGQRGSYRAAGGPREAPPTVPSAGDAVQWNRTEALALFNALKNGQAVPSSLLSGTTVG